MTLRVHSINPELLYTSHRVLVRARSRGWLWYYGRGPLVTQPLGLPNCPSGVSGVAPLHRVIGLLPNAQQSLTRRLVYEGQLWSITGVLNRTINHLIPPPSQSNKTPKQNIALAAPRMTTTKRESHLGLPVPRSPQKWNTGRLADHRSYFRKRSSRYKSDINKD